MVVPIITVNLFKWVVAVVVITTVNLFKWVGKNPKDPVKTKRILNAQRNRSLFVVERFVLVLKLAFVINK